MDDSKELGYGSQVSLIVLSCFLGVVPPAAGAQLNGAAPPSVQRPADAGGKQFKASWASDLNWSESSGTWIGDMNAQINAKTTWDDIVGNFVTRTMSGWDKDKYWAKITTSLALGSPYVEHPLLHSNFYTYLSTTTGYQGHFQVGRGYQRDAEDVRWIHILEPFNEPDWTAYTDTTWGPRRARLTNVLAANKANQGTIGIGNQM